MSFCTSAGFYSVTTGAASGVASALAGFADSFSSDLPDFAFFFDYSFLGTSSAFTSSTFAFTGSAGAAFFELFCYIFALEGASTLALLSFLGLSFLDSTLDSGLTAYLPAFLAGASVFFEA